MLAGLPLFLSYLCFATYAVTSDHTTEYVAKADMTWTPAHTNASDQWHLAHTTMLGIHLPKIQQCTQL